jgi:hypothetical protein
MNKGPGRHTPGLSYSVGPVAAPTPARYLDGVMASKTKTKGGAAGAKKVGKATARAAGRNGKRGAPATTTVKRGGRSGAMRGAGKSLALGVQDAPTARPRIEDPVQRILARYIPRLCAIFGYPPDRLTVRGASKTPVEFVQNSKREVALGSVVWLGRELGLHWSGLHNRQSEHEHGKTQIPELLGAHRFSLGLFATRFGALTGLGDDPETGAALPGPVGQDGQFVRQAYELIRADALREVNEAVPT